VYKTSYIDEFKIYSQTGQNAQKNKPVIFCEGNNDSCDSLLLTKILGDIASVVSCGSRFGMKHRVEAVRMATFNQCYAILDRDFSKEWQKTKPLLNNWTVMENNQEVLYGWYWQRKEIENYLLDPDVARKALGQARLPWNEYQTELNNVRDKVMVYQAARITLSVLGRTGQYYVKSSFGNERGSDDQYKFPNDVQLTEESCTQWIEDICEEYQQRHAGRLAQAKQLFKRYREECMKDGVRYKEYMSSFSGKDMAWMMDEWYINHGFIGTKSFLFEIIKGILNSTDDVSSWVEEWQELKSAVVCLPNACVPVQTISPDQKPSVSAPNFEVKTDTKPSDTNDPLDKSSQKE